MGERGRISNKSSFWRTQGEEEFRTQADSASLAVAPPLVRDRKQSQETQEVKTIKSRSPRRNRYYAKQRGQALRNRAMAETVTMSLTKSTMFDQNYGIRLDFSQRDKKASNDMSSDYRSYIKAQAQNAHVKSSSQPSVSMNINNSSTVKESDLTSQGLQKDVLRDLPKDVLHNLRLIERDKVQQAESQMTMKRSPTRLTIQQVVKLQKMADISGLSGYDVHSRRNHVGHAHSMQAHSLRADSEAMSSFMFNTRDNCSMNEDPVISGGE